MSFSWPAGAELIKTNDPPNPQILFSQQFEHTLLQIHARNLYAVSEKGTFMKWGFRIRLNQRANAGGGEAAEVSLGWPRPGCVVDINWVVKSEQMMLPKKRHTYIHIYMNTHARIKTHCESTETLRMCMDWSSLASGQKKPASSSCFWTLKNISTFLQLPEIFSACAGPAFLCAQGIMEIPKTDGAARESGGTVMPRPAKRRAFPA